MPKLQQHCRMPKLYLRENTPLRRVLKRSLCVLPQLLSLLSAFSGSSQRAGEQPFLLIPSIETDMAHPRFLTPIPLVLDHFHSLEPVKSPLLVLALPPPCWLAAKGFQVRMRLGFAAWAAPSSRTPCTLNLTLTPRLISVATDAASSIDKYLSCHDGPKTEEDHIGRQRKNREQVQQKEHGYP